MLLSRAAQQSHYSVVPLGSAALQRLEDGSGHAQLLGRQLQVQRLRARLGEGAYSQLAVWYAAALFSCPASPRRGRAGDDDVVEGVRRGRQNAALQADVDAELVDLCTATRVLGRRRHLNRPPHPSTR